MRVFGIAGFKNAGKTTLVVALLRELTGRGLKLATVKHAHHEFDIDHPGKDSYLHREAGASEVVIASSRRWAHVAELENETEPELDELLRHIGDVDLVLVEGYKGGAHPKLEVRRAGQDSPFLTDSHSNIRAIVSDAAIGDAPVPVLPRADVAGIADFILEQAELVSDTR
jgi:molybdopterin-guanine dinucleotide biosynthesis protein MobB